MLYMTRLLWFASLVLAAASLAGCGSPLTSSRTSPQKPGETQNSSVTLLLAAGTQSVALYRLKHDEAQIINSTSASATQLYASPETQLSARPDTKTLFSSYSNCSYRGECGTGVGAYSLENGQLRLLHSKGVYGTSFGISGSGKFAVSADGSLHTYAVQDSDPLLQPKRSVAGFQYTTADPKHEFVAAIAVDTSIVPGIFGHGTLRLFKLDENGYPIRLVDTRVESGNMIWNGDLIFIVNRNTGSREAPGYAVSAVRVVRDGDTATVEAHTGQFWYIGESPQIAVSPSNQFMVAGSARPGLTIYKLDPHDGSVVNWPGVPLAGYTGKLALLFDRDGTLLLAQSDTATNQTKLYRITLSAAGEIQKTHFLGSHDGDTSVLVQLDPDFDRISD